MTDGYSDARNSGSDTDANRGGGVLCSTGTGDAGNRSSTAGFVVDCIVFNCKAQRGVARAAAGFEESVLLEVGHRLADGDARDAEAPHEHALAREFLIGIVLADQDVVAQGGIDASVFGKFARHVRIVSQRTPDVRSCYDGFWPL